MRIDVDKATIDYIKEKGGAVNIDLYVSDGCCVGITEPIVNMGAPKIVQKFDEHTVDDVKIYVSKAIHLKDEVLTVKLKKFLGIKNISVSGIKMM